MGLSNVQSAGPMEEERILDAWRVLRDAGYPRTASLPYYRSLSRLPSEPVDLIRFARQSRTSPRAAAPEVYYRLFRHRHPQLFDLFSLFSLGREIDSPRLERCVGGEGYHLLETAGLVQRRGERVCPLLGIHLFDGLAFFHDAPGSGIPKQVRAYMARDSLRFAAYLKGELSGHRFRASLDLGTGCGIQAAVLSRRSDRVTAIDSNLRALSLARLNARINGIDNIDFRHADFFERLSGKFDFLVSNPPFLYLPRPLPEGPDPASDGGSLGIGIPRRILSRVDDLMEQHGEARILTSVPRFHRRPVLESWIRRNLVSRGLDVRLRFVEYLWREDQNDGYRARGLRTPFLAVAEVRRSSRPGLRGTPSSLAERMILARKVTGRSLERKKRRAAAFFRAVRPRRLGRVAPLALASAFRTAGVPVRPLRLAIEPSTRCPLDCISCARAERLGSGLFMEAETFGRILSEVGPRIVHFHGSGEPLANPQIDRLCAMSRETGARTAMLTSLPGESMIAAAERSLPHLDRLIVGVDAAHSETHSAIRRGSDLLGVVDGVRSLLRVRSRSNLGVSVILSFLILGRNYEEIPEFVRFAYRTGADAVTFLSLDLYGIESRGPSLVDSLSVERLVVLLRKARSVASRIGMPTNIDLLLESSDLLRHRYRGEALPGPARCLRPWISTYVTVDGDIRPCSRYAYDDDATLGRVSEERPFADIWNGPAYRRVRSELRDRRPALRACKDCPVPHEEGGLLGNLWRRRKSP